MKRISAQLHITKKIFILICLSILAVIMLIIGIYLLIKNDNKNKPQYNVDKYSDVVNWCNSSVSGSDLSIDCKALLLNIDTKEDGTSCFDVQVISNSNELKDLTVCEKGGSLTYTNEVLGYKKLMPIDIIFSYSQDSNVLKKSYSFTNASFKEMDESYIQNIVNDDIANLVTQSIDKNAFMKVLDDNSLVLAINLDTYTVSNSIDFCPNSSKLPNYVTETNKKNYAKYLGQNILKEEDYSKYKDIESSNGIITELFACDSSKYLNYSFCTLQNKQFSTIELSGINELVISEITWKNTINNINNIYLKKISLLYDNLVQNKPSNIEFINKFNEIISSLNYQTNLDEMTFCSTYKIYDLLGDNTEEDYIKSIVLNNLPKVSSYQCLNILSEQLDQNGMYLKTYYANLNNDAIFRFYNDCNNLRTVSN